MPFIPTGEAETARTLRATDGWHKLNKSLVVDVPKQLARATRARRRLAKLR